MFVAAASVSYLWCVQWDDGLASTPSSVSCCDASRCPGRISLHILELRYGQCRAPSHSGWWRDIHALCLFVIILRFCLSLSFITRRARTWQPTLPRRRRALGEHVPYGQRSFVWGGGGNRASVVGRAGEKLVKCLIPAAAFKCARARARAPDSGGADGGWAAVTHPVCPFCSLLSDSLWLQIWKMTDGGSCALACQSLPPTHTHTSPLSGSYENPSLIQAGVFVQERSSDFSLTSGAHITNYLWFAVTLCCPI